VRVQGAVGVGGWGVEEGVEERKEARSRGVRALGLDDVM
jgi:hypothetical protein